VPNRSKRKRSMNRPLFKAETGHAELQRSLCTAALSALVAGDSGVFAATVSTADGIEIASAGAIADADAGKLAAITSSLQALGVAVSSEVHLGSLESVAIEAGNGRMLCIEIPLQDRSLILAAVAAKKSLLALSLFSTRHCAQRIVADWAACSTHAGTDQTFAV
jgi:uncharacterized protein